ncbi:MAG: DUF2188 domain-containing protein [Firmicutes bacterium]|nr:DUF2188 domain-containing protein [Bacillota bacterium]
MAETVHDVFLKDGKWHVKGVGNEKSTYVCNTQEEAIAKAKEIAKNNDGKVKVHNTEGKVRAQIGNKDAKPAKKPAAKPAVKADAKPAAKTDAKPAAKAEAKPVAKAEKKPAKK